MTVHAECCFYYVIVMLPCMGVTACLWLTPTGVAN